MLKSLTLGPIGNSVLDEALGNRLAKEEGLFK